MTNMLLWFATLATIMLLASLAGGGFPDGGFGPPF
jgi:hypothetical protein